MNSGIKSLTLQVHISLFQETSTMYGTYTEQTSDGTRIVYFPK